MILQQAYVFILKTKSKMYHTLYLTQTSIIKMNLPVDNNTNVITEVEMQAYSKQRYPDNSNKFYSWKQRMKTTAIVQNCIPDANLRVAVAAVSGVGGK